MGCTSTNALQRDLETSFRQSPSMHCRCSQVFGSGRTNRHRASLAHEQRRASPLSHDSALSHLEKPALRVGLPPARVQELCRCVAAVAAALQKMTLATILPRASKCMTKPGCMHQGGAHQSPTLLTRTVTELLLPSSANTESTCCRSAAMSSFASCAATTRAHQRPPMRACESARAPWPCARSGRPPTWSGTKRTLTLPTTAWGITENLVGPKR